MLFAVYADFLYRHFRASGWCFGTLLPSCCRVMWLLWRFNEHTSTLISITLMETTWARTGWLSFVVLLTDSISLHLDLHTHGQLLCFHYSSFRRITWRLVLLFVTILHVSLSWFAAFPTGFFPLAPPLRSKYIHFSVPNAMIHICPDTNARRGGPAGRVKDNFSPGLRTCTADLGISLPSVSQQRCKNLLFGI